RNYYSVFGVRRSVLGVQRFAFSLRGSPHWALVVFPCCLQCRTRSPPRYLPALVLARNSRQRPHEFGLPPRHRQCRLQGVSPYLSRPARVAFASHFAAAFHLALRSRL